VANQFDHFFNFITGKSVISIIGINKYMTRVLKCNITHVVDVLVLFQMKLTFLLEGVVRRLFYILIDAISVIRTVCPSKCA